MKRDYLEKEPKLDTRQKIFIIASIITVSGIFGWLYEYFFYFLNSGMKTFYMRGGNFLPWINIYAYGAFLILFLTFKRRKHPLQVFLLSAISTGILEYFSGYILYEKLGWLRCWSYNEEILNFGNIGGFVCLRSVTVFGICGLLLIYGILPVLIKLATTKDLKILLPISIIICSIILFDEVYNLIFADLLSLPKASTFYKSLGFKYIYFTR